MTTKIGSGATPRGGSSVYRVSGTTFIRSQNVFDHYFSDKGLAFIDDEAAQKLGAVAVQHGDVLLNITGDGDTIARCCVVPDRVLPARVNQHVLIIRTQNEVLLPDYLQRYLSHPTIRSYMLNHSSGGSRRAITKGHAEGFEIVLPPVSTQRAIAETLGALDDLIEANCTSFVLAGRLIDSLFERLTLSDYENVRLMDAVRFTFGEPFSSKDFNDVGVGRPLIRIRDLKSFSPQLFTTETRARETIVQPGDVIVGMDAEFRPTIWCGKEGLLNQRVCRATPLLGGRAFAFKLLAEPLSAVESYKTGTTVSHLNKSDLEQITVRIPDQDTLSDFERTTDPMYWSIVELHEENRRLARLRDLLLPNLLSGEIRVRDAQNLVEAAV